MSVTQCKIDWRICFFIMRVTPGANAWKKVEGVIGVRRISQKLGNVMLSSCVTPACMNALETMALTEKQQEKVQVCENNVVRRTVGVKRADTRRTGELKVEVGVKERFKKNLARSKLK